MEAAIGNQDRAVDIGAGLAQHKQGKVDDVFDRAQTARGDGHADHFGRIAGKEPPCPFGITDRAGGDGVDPNTLRPTRRRAYG